MKSLIWFDAEQARNYHRQYYKEHREKCREKCRVRARQFRERHPRRAREIDKKYKSSHRKELNARARVQCKTHRIRITKRQRVRRQEYPEKIRVYGIIQRHSEEYPLAHHCEFCGSTEHMEHGHLDYKDDGHNYLTVCHQCNLWMEKEVD